MTGSQATEERQRNNKDGEKTREKIEKRRGKNSQKKNSEKNGQGPGFEHLTLQLPG